MSWKTRDWFNFLEQGIGPYLESILNMKSMNIEPKTLPNHGVGGKQGKKSKLGF